MSVRIRLNSIKEEEFKFSEKDIDSIESKLLTLGFLIAYEVDVKKNIFATKLTVIYNYKLNKEDRELLRFTIVVKFKVDDLKNVAKYNEDDKSFNVTNEMLITFLGIAISSARGMLVYKLSGTILSKYYLPLVDVKEMLKTQEIIANTDSVQ